jgi:hypothetical protein
MVSKLLSSIVFTILMISLVSAWSIDFTYPVEGDNYSSNVDYFDWSYSDIENVSSCWYSLDNGVTNKTMSTCDFHQDDSINSDEDTNAWTVWVNDTSGTEYSASVNFWVDSIYPALTVLNPATDPYYTNSDTITINALLGEANPSFDIFGRAVLLKLYLGPTFFNQWMMNFNSATNISTFSYSPLSEGSYTYVLSTEDTIGHETNISGQYILDTTPPVITLIGSDNITMEFNTTYNESGATANDNLEGDITSSIVIDDSALNVNTIGSYNITYDVSDSAGNAADTVIRTVNIVDTTPPVISLVGDNPQVIIVEDNYTELGATANDNYDGDLTANITIDDSDVNTSVIGSYIIEYSVTDTYGNTAEVNRTVNVVDNVSPVITLIGNATITLERAVDTYTELGATASDNYDGNLTGNITINSSEVDVSVAGSYHVYYYVEDSSGNNDTETRTVNVVDTTNPLITIHSPLDNATYTDSSVSLQVSSNEDATWNYSLDNGLTNTTFTPNTTLSSLANGDYNLSVYAADLSGNENSSVVSFTIDVPAKKSSSGRGGSSCTRVWNCSAWDEWTPCLEGNQTRKCIEWEKIGCGKGMKIEDVKNLIQTQACTIPEPEESEPELEVVAPIEPEIEETKGFLSKITGGAVGFVKSGTGKATIITIAALSLLLGIVHFIRKRSAILLE